MTYENQERRTAERLQARMVCGCGAALTYWHRMGSTPEGIHVLGDKVACAKCDAKHYVPAWRSRLTSNAKIWREDDE